jgi:hypothetical protein
MKGSTIALACAVVGAAGYVTWLRPRHLRWGSTQRERKRVWAGDEFMPEPLIQSTRVITIHAVCDDVWPWIAQIGQDRGGFYSYTALENFVGAEMQNADQIHLEWQYRRVGDKVWLGAPSKYGGQAYMIVARWIPGRALVLVAPPDWERIQAGEPADHTVWSFILEPVGHQVSRLVARSLGGTGLSVREKLATYLFWEPAHFIMERAMLLGIKERAETASSATLQTTGHKTLELVP